MSIPLERMVLKSLSHSFNPQFWCGISWEISSRKVPVIRISLLERSNPGFKISKPRGIDKSGGKTFDKPDFTRYILAAIGRTFPDKEQDEQDNQETTQP